MKSVSRGTPSRRERSNSEAQIPTKIKLSCTRATQLEGLEEGVVPIEPIPTSCKVKVYTKEMKAFQRTIKRLQVPLTAVYAFTSDSQHSFTTNGHAQSFQPVCGIVCNDGQHSVRLLRDFESLTARSSKTSTTNNCLTRTPSWKG